MNALPEYAVGSLFPGVSHEFPDLLSEEEPAWLALERLGDFLSSSSMPLLDACIVTGVPLPVNFFLMPDGSVRDDLAVACNRATKGRMAAVSGGELLSDVSVLCAGSVFIGEGIRIGKGVAVEAGALVKGPAIIGDGTEVRQGAYLRGNVFAGRNCVLGHTTEVKHSIFLDNAKAGHFAYVGDSIFGRNVNLGAGTKMANLKFVSGTVRIRVDGRAVDTGRRKLGAILGDNVQTGCNSVTNPGTVVGPDSVIAPNTTVMPGCYPGKSIIR